MQTQVEKIKLPEVTLLGVDCVDIDRLNKAVEICQQAFEFVEVKLLTSIPSSLPHIVPIEPIGSVEEYSYFALANLDDYVSTSHVLVIQYDGFILNPQAWTNDFLRYDYIGAPWLVQDWSVRDFDFPPSLLGQLVVGNGGFSLRSKKLTALCKEMMSKNQITRCHPEDVALGVYERAYLESHGIVFAPISLAKQFSFEAKNDAKDFWDGELGFHGLKWTDISRWTSIHSEYGIDNPGAKSKTILDN